MDDLSVFRLLGGVASEKVSQARLHAGAPQALRSLEQAALLAAAMQAQRASAADELRAWQAAPFLDAVLRQRRTRFLLRGAARLLRCISMRHSTLAGNIKQLLIVFTRPNANCSPNQANQTLTTTLPSPLRIFFHEQGSARARAAADARARAAGAAAAGGRPARALAAARAPAAARPLPCLQMRAVSHAP